MTSQERREARYQRRKAKRQAKREARCAALGPIDKVFSYRKMFFYGRRCCNGVRWKQSTQNFELHLFSGTARRRREVLEGRWKPRKCNHFTLRERGKVRPIDAPHITDRQVHKTLCNEVLVPLYNPSMIYDNGASQRDKGLHWHFRRIKDQLHWHFRRWGREGAVGLIDLKGFFPNAPRWSIYQRHQRLITNPDLRWLADTVVRYAPSTAPERGMPLGVEPSQQAGCATENTKLIKGANMELKEDNGDGIDSWKEVTLIYNAALKMMETKMEILNDEFQHVHRYNPIEHIKARIKTPESIVKKLKRDGHESTIDNMVKYVNDIAGIRIICSFTSDIYRIVDMISEQRDIRVIGVKDYITFPKASGYKSYHMIVTVPVYLSDRTVDTKVEIQIRTVAMDFWASLEHKIHYKFEGDVPENIKNELVECAKMVADLDVRMLKLNEEILTITRERMR